MKLPWSSHFCVAKFESKVWSRLSYTTKIEQLQALEDKMAKAQGRNPRLVECDLSLSNGGYYATNGKGGGVIRVGVYDLHNNSFECMDTVLHEGRHAYQDDVINERIPNAELDATKESWAHDDKRGCYISHSEGCYCDYFYQPQEADAYEYARAKMDEMSAHFQNDSQYQNYVANRDYNAYMARAEGMQKYCVDSEEDVKTAVRAKVEERYQSYSNQTSNQPLLERNGNDSPLSQTNQIAGQLPNDLPPSSSSNDNPIIAGRLPEQDSNNPSNPQHQIAGTTPDKKQGLDLSKQGGQGPDAGKALAEEAKKGANNGIDPNIKMT